MKLIESNNYCSATAIYVKSPAGQRRAAMFMAINNREIGLCLWISGLPGHSRVPNQRQQTGQSASWRDPITSIWPWFAMNLIRINQVETLIQLHIPFQDHESFIHVHQQKKCKNWIHHHETRSLIPPRRVVAPICCCTSGIYKLTVPLKPDATWCCCL